MLHQGRGYDIILCDINMPNMSGDECIGRLREWERAESSSRDPNSTPNTVFALTGEERWTADTSTWTNLDMDGCIAKPVQHKKMQAVLAHAAQRKADRSILVL